MFSLEQVYPSRQRVKSKSVIMTVIYFLSGERPSLNRMLSSNFSYLLQYLLFTSYIILRLDLEITISAFSKKSIKKSTWNMRDIFHDIVFPNGGVTVLLMALFSLTVNLFGVPLYLAIIDYEDRINRQSTLLTRLSTAICRIYLCWTPIALVDIFRYKTVTILSH